MLIVRSSIHWLGALGLALFGFRAYGAGLGDIHVRSFLGEPLDAEIGLTAVEGMDMKRLEVGLASPEDFNRAGIPQPLVLGRLRFRIEEHSDGSPFIRVYSTQPIEEPDLQFLAKAQVDGHAVIKQYTVLLDPPGGYGQLFQGELTPAAAQMDARTREPVTERAPVVVTDRVYGPIRRGETLWQIAGKVRPGRSVSIQRTMVALLRANPQAFEGSNINGLRVGATLAIPSLDEITAISEAEAVQAVRYQNDPSQVSAVLRQARRREESGAQPAVVGAGELAQPQPVGEDRLPTQIASTPEPQADATARQDQNDSPSSRTAPSPPLAAMSTDATDSREAVGVPVAVGTQDVAPQIVEPDEEIARLERLLREKEAEVVRLQAELRDAEIILAASLPELGGISVVTLPPATLAAPAVAESGASPQLASEAPSITEMSGEEAKVDANSAESVPPGPEVTPRRAADTPPQAEVEPVPRSEPLRQAPAARPASPVAADQGILRELALLLTEVGTDPVNLGLIGGGVLGVGALGLAAVRRRRRPAREDASDARGHQRFDSASQGSHQGPHAEIQAAERAPQAAIRVASGNPPRTPAAPMRGPALAEAAPAVTRLEGAGPAANAGVAAAGVAAAGLVAAATAAEPRPAGPGQATNDDHLTAELSDLSDLDLEDADIDMPDLVTGAGDTWKATDEADLSFDLDLPARSATVDGTVPGDAPADEPISLNMAGFDDQLLDLEDSNGWDAVEPGAGRIGVPTTGALQVEELNAALEIESGERDGQAGRFATGFEGPADALDFTDAEGGELDLLTETVIMDGLEFGTGVSPTSTASLSMAEGGSATKLDLARAYLDMGDADGARTMLDEVLQEGTEAQRREAEALVAHLGRVSNL